MIRTPNWEKRLIETLADWEDLPFQFGYTDCAGFAAAAVEATTGKDLLLHWRGRYGGRLRAFALLRARGYRTLAEAADDAFRAAGCPIVDVREARAGDIGVTADDILCVRTPAGFIARDESGGYRKVKAVKAWGVGP